MTNGWLKTMVGALVPLLVAVCANVTWAQGALTNGAVHNGLLSAASEEDSWTFTAPAGAAIVIRAGEIGGDSDVWPWLRLYAPGGTLVASGYNSHAIELAATAAVTGTYTVVIASNDSGHDAVGDYSINLALVPGTPVVSGGDEGGPMTNGLNYPGQLHVGDLDQWTFTATAGAAIVVRMGEVGGDSEIYPWLRLYGPTGTLLDSGYNNQAVEVAATATVSGTYTIVATTNDAGHDGVADYLLTLALVPGTPQISAGDQGGPLTNGLNHPGEIHVADLDQWTFTATAGAAVILRMGEIGGDSDMYPWMRLYGPTGTLLASGYNNEAIELAITAPQSGTYTVLATTNDSGHDAAADYLLTLALIPGTPSISAGDHGGTLVNGRNHTGALHVGDLDQWQFTAAAGSAVVIRGAEVGGDSAVYPWLRLYGPNGALLDSGYNNQAIEVAITAPTDGTYTLVVASNDSGHNDVGAYQLTMALIPGTPEIPIDDQGGPMTNGLNHVGDIHVGDLDQWTFTAPAGAAILLRMGEIGGDSAVYPWLRLYGPTGTLLSSTYNNQAVEVAVTAPTAGTYTVIATTNDSGHDATADYLLTLALIPGTPQISPGDHGGPLTNGLTHGGDLHVGDLDQWRFTAAAGSAILIRAGEVGGDSAAYPWLRLYGPNGALIDSGYNSQAVEVAATAPTTGVYTVVVATADSGLDAVTSYLMTLALVPGTPQLTQGDQGGGAAENVNHAGSLYVGDLDQWRFPSEAGTPIEVNLSEVGGNSAFYPWIRLYGPTGTLLRSGYDSETVAVSVVAPTTGVYTVVVSSNDSGHDATGDYLIRVNGVVGVDTDGDGLPDDWESRFGTNPNSGIGDDGADGDPDLDTLTNLQEYAAGTHPRGFYHPLLAEGASNSFFSVRYALLNVGTAPGRVLIRYFQPGGAVVSVYEVLPPNLRRTFTPPAQLTSPDFSIVVEADEQIVLDRTMTWAGGFGSHAETAVSGPATTWYLAEGSTSGVFSLFYLIQNPNPVATTLNVRYLLPGGQAPIERTYNLPASSRTTIPVDEQGGVLASTDVSAVLSAALPIVVERAMYRNSATQPFAAGHNSAGVTAPATSWFLAEGATGPFFDCFILLANPNPQPATATVAYLLSDGRTFTKAYTVPANGRYTVWVDNEEIGGPGVRPLENVAVSSTVTSTQPIIVERTMWWPGPQITSDFWTEAHNSPGVIQTGTQWALAEGEVGGTQNAETYILIANTSATAGTAQVTLYFEDGTSATRAFSLLPRSRRNVSVSSDFPAAAGRRFGAVIDSVGATPAQIVVERAMYTSPSGVTWAAGTNAAGMRRR